MVWGSGIFMEFYDDPALIRAFFELITAAYREFMDRWEREFPPLSDRFRCHWGWGHRGKIVLRDDSAMNLSPDMYAAAWSTSAAGGTTTSTFSPGCRS